MQWHCRVVPSLPEWLRNPSAVRRLTEEKIMGIGVTVLSSPGWTCRILERLIPSVVQSREKVPDGGQMMELTQLLNSRCRLVEDQLSRQQENNKKAVYGGSHASLDLPHYVSTMPTRPSDANLKTQEIHAQRHPDPDSASKRSLLRQCHDADISRSKSGGALVLNIETERLASKHLDQYTDASHAG
jgi:hypothetical protein